MQWQGFNDPDSGIGYCALDVWEVSSPGKSQLGQSCVCSEFMPSPTCNCESALRCATVTPTVQAFARSRHPAWRYSALIGAEERRSEDEDFMWTRGLLDEDTAVGVDRICLPEAPANLGSVAVSEPCTWITDCAPLSSRALLSLPNGSDASVLCIEVQRVPWFRLPFADNFCCGANQDVTAICLPAAWADAQQLAPPPPPALPDAPASPACAAVEVELHLSTGHAHAHTEYSHLDWLIDGRVQPSPRDCSPYLCTGGDPMPCCAGRLEPLAHRRLARL